MQREPFAQRLSGAFQSCWLRYGLLPYQLLLVGLAAWACQWSLRTVWPFTIDDAGISYAYAKHIAEGHGPVAAIGGPWVEGYSNPSWVFLLVPFHWLGVPLPSVAKLLGAALFCATLVFGTGHLALTEERRWRSFGAAEVGLAIGAAVCLEVVVWVVAGLENALFSSLLLLLAFLDARESKHPSRLGLSGLVAFGLCITRPEGVLYAAPLLAIKLVQVLRKREPLRQAKSAALLFMAPLAVYHAAHYLTFGELVPNTYYAKPGSRDWAKGYEYLVESLSDSALLYVLPFVLVGLIGKPRLKLLLGWSCVAGSVFVLYSGGDWMPHGRFLALFALPALVLVAMGVSNLTHGAVWLGRGRLPREVALFVLAGGLLWFWWKHHAPRLHELARHPWCHFCERVTDTSALQRIAKRAELPSLSLLTHDFGGPAWLSDERLYPIDFLGLCDRSVALIRHDRSTNVNSAASMRNDFRFYQYFMHEQPSPPSWIHVPPNFWKLFDLSPEFRWGYFRLSPRLLPRARRDAFFGLHRGELVDYFPPLPRADFRQLTPRLTLVGAASFGAPATPDAGRSAGEAAAHSIRTLLSVVPRGPQRGTEQLKLRIDAGGQSVESGPVPIARELKGVASQLEDGQPLSFDFSVTLPAGSTPPERIWLGVSSQPDGRGKPGGAPSAEWAFSDLGQLEPGAALPAYYRTLPRYPAALPAPLHPELLRLRQPVTMAIEQRRHEGHSVVADTSLSRRLLDLAEDFEAQGDTAQAYLSYVWATHVDRRAWELASDAVFRLRQVAIDDRHTTELALLEHYYATGDRAALARLVAYYLAASRPLEADHFFRWRPSASPDSPTSTPATSGPALPASASSIPDAGLWAALGDALTMQLDSSRALVTSESEAILRYVAEDPLGDRLDFETAELDAWEGTKQAYLAGASDQHGLKGVRGYHGRGILSSLQGGTGARGSLLSAEFPLRGRMLSLLVGGGSRKRRVGVELIVEGNAVKSAHGNDSDFMYPELWDVSAYEGKPARLRVFDRSARSYVLVDRVLLWR